MSIAELEAQKAEMLMQVAAIHAKIAAAKEPLRIEARKVCEDHGFNNHFGAEETLALAALRRGMELAAAPLMPVNAMTEAPILRGVGKITGDGWKDTTKQGEVVYVWNAHLEPPFMEGQYPRIGCEQWSASDQQYDFSPATVEDIAAIRVTLARGPVAAWPGDCAATIEEVVDLLADAGSLNGRMAYSSGWHDKRRDILDRLRAHQTGKPEGGEAAPEWLQNYALEMAHAHPKPTEPVDDAGENIAGRLCDWDREGEPPVPLMQEAAAFIRRTRVTAPLLAALEQATGMLAEAADSIEAGDLAQSICCSGYECGCYGADKGSFLVWNIRQALATITAELAKHKGAGDGQG